MSGPSMWLLAGAVMLLPLHAMAARPACDRQPVRAAHVQVIGRDMLVEGVPTSVYGMEFSGTSADVSNEFHAFWTHARVPARERRDASGLLLAALDGACHYVLVVPARGDSGSVKGLMSVMRLDAAGATHRVEASRIALPRGARTVSDIESRDPGQAGRTWLIDMSGEAKDNAQHYTRQLQQAGWRVVAQMPALRLDGSQRTTGHVLAMQRGSERIDAVFSHRNGQTEAVIHATTGP